MNSESKIAKAELRELQWRDGQTTAQEINSDKTLKVQFNPETLRVAYANQQSGGDQRGQSATQFVGKGTTRLTLDLIFDLTTPLPASATPEVNDVRKLTQKVNYFIQPKPTDDDKFLPPGVRFIWGSFLFDGIMTSMNENLEYFSEDGRPLRASVSITLVSQEIQFQLRNLNTPTSPAGNNAPAGTRPLTPAMSGESVQGLASKAGKPDAWKGIAAANNIENPRQLAAGTMLDMSAGLKVGVRVGGSVSGGIGGSIGAGISGGVGLSASASIGGNLSVNSSINPQSILSNDLTVQASASASTSSGINANIQTN